MISFIIVTYNSDETIVDCINAIVCSSQGIDFEIIVVDNDSHTGDILSTLNLDCLKLFLLKDNIGFAAANNIGFDNSKYDKIVFVNPDCILNCSFVNKIKESELNNKLITSNLVTKDGHAQKSIHAVPTILNLTKKKLGFVYQFWFQGALVAGSRESLENIGCWSEDYFMYAEDLDICYKAIIKGYKLEVMQCDVIHIGGTSTSTVWSHSERQKKIEKANVVFFRKFHILKNYILIKLFQAMFGLFTANFNMVKNSYYSLRDIRKKAGNKK